MDEALTSAPNHSCPAKFSCITSSGNLTRKSLFALSAGITTSIMRLQIVKTCKPKFETLLLFKAFLQWCDTLLKNIILHFVHYPNLVKPLCFRNWFYFYLLVNRIWKTIYSTEPLGKATLKPWAIITWTWKENPFP